MSSKTISLFDGDIMRKAVADSFIKLNPRQQLKNPVMFVTLIGALLTFQQLFTSKEPFSYVLQIALWLLFTVIFANFAEAVAEGRGKAQARALRASRKQLVARKKQKDGTIVSVDASLLRKDDPADGEVVEGIASVDESAVTGESAPVIRESGGDRSSVTGGTKVNSDWIKVRVTANPGEGFLDKMISLVEGAERQKTPNEIALNILLAGMTLIFMVVLVTLQAFAIYSADPGLGRRTGGASRLPDPDDDRRPAVGDRHRRHRPADAVQRPGDVGPRRRGGGRRGHLLLDKTGTITLGNRMATEFIPAPGVTLEELALDAQLSSLSDETPEGRSIVVLAKQFVPKPKGHQRTRG
jgi:K+-transporting ATPase ATPase B chain